MFNRKLVAAGVAGALGLIVAAAPVHAAPVTNRALEIVGAGAAADPLIAVEANRSAIVDRIVADHADTIAAMGSGAEASLRTALAGLRADQLLAATLVGSLAEVTAIVAGQASDGAVLQRFVALAPSAAGSALPSAQAYLVRNAETLTIVAAADVAASGGQVVGYFTSAGTMTAAGMIEPKDGSGTGANSWIGYTAGGNVASGSGSAVAAGTFNAATNTNASIFAGQSNQASGVSSLVIGGFDNHATGQDALVGAGAGNRAIDARSIVVGGGYNLASGPWSFVGGGGRDGIASTIAGSNPKDNIASGAFSVVTGGQSNRATNTYATVGGGLNNVASGSGATVAGGGFSGFTNVASGSLATISGGVSNTASGTQSVIGGGYSNVASALNATVPGGFDNTAAGEGSFAAGYQANAAHAGAFVWGDQTGGISSTAANQFVIRATGGMFLQSPRGIATDAGDNPIITKGFDPFDGTAPANKTGLGRWGLFMEPSTLTIGMPALGGRSFRVATYALNGAATTVVGVDQSGMISQPFDFGQNLTFAGVNKGIGSQLNSVYSRTWDGVYWYAQGVHSDTQGDPGTGGAVLGALTTGGATIPVVTGVMRAQSFSTISDRNRKTGFAPVDAKAVLAQVNALPITTWSFKNEAEAGIRHIGPMSQDFKQAFDVGADERSIATVDEGGVALAAIQGLYAELKDRDATIAAQAGQIATLQQKVSELVAAQDDVKVMKAALVELLRERSELGTRVRLIGSGAALPAH